jgi:hypothetical protein
LPFARRYSNVSEELAVAATALHKAPALTPTGGEGETDGASSSTSSSTSSGSDSGSDSNGDTTAPGEYWTRRFYTFNSETTVHARALDGSQLVTQRKYLVPTDEAYDELIRHGVPDFPAGAVERSTCAGGPKCHQGRDAESEQRHCGLSTGWGTKPS